MEIDAATGRLIKILGQMGQSSQDALRAGIAGDEPGTRQAVDRLRLFKAKLGTVDQAARELVDRLPLNQQRPLREALSHIKAAEEFVRTWSKRYQGIGNFEELSSTSDGRHAILDYTLPSDWNFEGDIFIVFDESELLFATELLERGQKRILFVGTDKQMAEQFIDVEHANSALDLRTYFMKLTNPVPVRLSFIAPRDAPDRELIWKDIKQAFTLAHSNFHTHKALGGAWMTQGLQNLDAIAQSANLAALKPHLKGLPVVIISPGPSLDKNIHLLKALKGRAILMAAAQCARALQAAGVVPDFIIIADPGNLVYFLDGVDTSQVDGLIAGVSCHPEFFKKPFKNTIAFNANSALDAWISDIFGDTLPISAAGSVSIDCFFIAKYWECSQIIMVGLDLALSEGRGYSRQSANSEADIFIDEETKTLKFSNLSENMQEIFTAQGKARNDNTETLMTLPGYFGDTVFTRPNYHLFHGEFVGLARHEISTPNPTPLVNCTEGGAYIDGFEHISLSDAIAKYIGESDNNIPEKIQSACQGTDRMRRLKLSGIAKIKIAKDIEEVMRLVKECKTLSRPGKSTSVKMNKLKSKERDLINSIRRTPFISLPNVDMVKKALEMAGDASNINETNLVARFIYDSVEATSKQVLEIVKTPVHK